MRQSNSRSRSMNMSSSNNNTHTDSSGTRHSHAQHHACAQPHSSHKATESTSTRAQQRVHRRHTATAHKAPIRTTPQLTRQACPQHDSSHAMIASRAREVFNKTRCVALAVRAQHVYFSYYTTAVCRGMPIVVPQHDSYLL